MKQHQSVTIGIATCYGGTQLPKVIGSIRRDPVGRRARIVVQADSVPISESIKQELKRLDVTVRENPYPGSQMHKAKQMIADCATDLFVFTQDDVIFSADSLVLLTAAFAKDPRLTFATTRVEPLPPASFFERIVGVGVRIANRIQRDWNGGDNFLGGGGRCWCFRTEFLKKYTIPDGVVNADVYLYFENRRLGGTFTRVNEAVVSIKSPSTFTEHLNQSARYSYIAEEMTRFFGPESAEACRIPTGIGLRATVIEALTNPFWFLLYVTILIKSRLNKKQSKTYNKTQWAFDPTTKKL